jgi:uncharacterized DUF497 family protein
MRFEMGRSEERTEPDQAPSAFLGTAVLALDDPYALTLRDESSHDEERWITLGAVGPEAVLLVVHTWFEADGEGAEEIGDDPTGRRRSEVAQGIRARVPDSGEYALAPRHDKFRAGRSFAAGEARVRQSR